MNKTKIETFDYTWNPVTGCLHGCEYCYALKIAKRFKGNDEGAYKHAITIGHKGNLEWIFDIPNKLERLTNGKPMKEIISTFPYGFQPTFHRYRIDEPQRIKKPQNIFVCSMADLFGDWIPDEWIQKVFEACERAPQHMYFFLTKNHKRYLNLIDNCILPKRENFFYGSTVTSSLDNYVWSKQFNFFISIEPILDELYNFNHWCRDRLKWIIIGAETGNRKNKVISKRKWIEKIVHIAKDNNIPIFMKNNLKSIWGDELLQEYPFK